MLRKALFILVIGFGVLMQVGNANAATAYDAKKFVDDLGNKVLDVINSNETEEQKKKKLEEMFTDNVDMEWMGSFVLAQGKKEASKEQLERYMENYKKYLIVHYTADFRDYTGSKYNITGATDDGDGMFTVAMQIKSKPDAPETRAGYSVYSENNGEFKIRDIIIEGVSLITTQRSDFDAVLKKNGMDGLISAIEAKINVEKGGNNKKRK